MIWGTINIEILLNDLFFDWRKYILYSIMGNEQNRLAHRYVELPQNDFQIPFRYKFIFNSKIWITYDKQLSKSKSLSNLQKSFILWFPELKVGTTENPVIRVHLLWVTYIQFEVNIMIHFQLLYILRLLCIPALIWILRRLIA